MAKKAKARPDPWSLPYRPCVGIMLLNADGLVWVGRRILEPGSEASGSDSRWQMPQGGIDDGEDAYPAALRELYEETGIRNVALLAEAPHWITYDLPEHLVGVAFKGRYRGQTQKWFALRFIGDEGEIAINPPPGGHKPEFEAWAWREMDTLPDLIVPFKRQSYQQIVTFFRHLAP